MLQPPAALGLQNQHPSAYEHIMALNGTRHVRWLCVKAGNHTKYTPNDVLGAVRVWQPALVLVSSQ
jgi:hypothetical protein